MAVIFVFPLFLVLQVVFQRRVVFQKGRLFLDTLLRTDAFDDLYKFLLVLLCFFEVGFEFFHLFRDIPEVDLLIEVVTLGRFFELWILYFVLYDSADGFQFVIDVDEVFFNLSDGVFENPPQLELKTLDDAGHPESATWTTGL